MGLYWNYKPGLLLLLPILLFIQLHSQGLVNRSYDIDTIKGIKKSDKYLNFLVIGDWGHNGESYQKQVANAMGHAARDMEAQFVITTGDNFYPSGVKTTNDPHWVSSFESIYKAQSLHVKWYPVLGNHDYVDNPDAEVEYSKQSNRWDMPARYYSRKFFINGDTTQSVLIVFIDTDPFEKKMRGVKTDSVKYTVSATEDQQQWLEELLSDKTVKWKIVVGHHPVYTSGWRKYSNDTKKMRRFLEPIFKKYGVNLYICGHEHHLEHSKAKGMTHYIISGAGAEIRKTLSFPTIPRFGASEQGFATFSIDGNQARVQFINYNGKVIYNTVIENRR